MVVLSLVQIFVFVLWLPLGSPICYDQSPFWFLTRPIVENLYDDQGRMLSDKTRVRWGALHNFKCVDYFQVEYRQRFDPGSGQRDDPNNKIVTPRIDRHSRYIDIDVDPCTKYVIKVLASEDYQGRREDFKAYSLEVHHKVDYTPRFISKISIKELKIRKPGARGRRRRSKREAGNLDGAEDEDVIFGEELREETPPPGDYMEEGEEAKEFGFTEIEGSDDRERRAALLDWDGDYSQFQGDEPEEETTTEPPPEPVNIRISWRLNQIDYPTCLDYFVVDYYDITYNESTYSRTLGRPFGPTLQMDIGSDSVPCDSEFRYILRVFGLTGATTTVPWTPPSCIFTTQAPTTTLDPYERADKAEDDMWYVLQENDELKAKIEGLNDEYSKIGMEVFHAFSDDIFGVIEVKLAERDEIRRNQSSWGWGK